MEKVKHRTQWQLGIRYSVWKDSWIESVTSLARCMNSYCKGMHALASKVARRQFWKRFNISLNSKMTTANHSSSSSSNSNSISRVLVAAPINPTPSITSKPRHTNWWATDLTRRNLSQNDNLHKVCWHLIYRQVAEIIKCRNPRKSYNFSKNLEQWLSKRKNNKVLRY